MDKLQIDNPFPGAVSFLALETRSTMEEARRLAGLGCPPGSLVAAELQTEGRGRVPDRRWESERGRNLLFTLILDPSATALPGLSLRTGLALCEAASALADHLGLGLPSPPSLKWPNDLVFGSRKAAGVLCEASPEGVFIGLGINCNQKDFDRGLGRKATSLSLELGAEIDRWLLLELVLGRLKAELSDPSWKDRAEERLWKRGEVATFTAGAPGSRIEITGLIAGLTEEGALLVRADGGKEPRAYSSGELSLEGPSR
jgi:BirA family biotin operon repressor/biotin-[acetyl-CoA-carboxylase] ligase